MNPNMRFIISRALPLVFLIFSSLSHAVFLDEIQVYDGEINEPGEFGLEIHANTTLNGQTSPNFTNQRVSQGGLRLTPEFSYGLTKTVELGFYLPTNYTPEYGYDSAGLRHVLNGCQFKALILSLGHLEEILNTLFLILAWNILAKALNFAGLRRGKMINGLWRLIQ
jgi:hypothetical protein